MYISNKRVTALKAEKQVKNFLNDRKEVLIDELFDFTKSQKIKVYNKLEFLDTIEDYIIVNKKTLFNMT